MNLLQLKASDPEFSTWVSASAGTGKTKILTDRVLRLLLQNVSFDKILCLTFTNAAASEMKERIASALCLWSNANEEELNNYLTETLGCLPKLQDITNARKLYKLYLRAEEKINIQTIHSFCQKLLKKFPLESGVAPGFKIIDEFKSHSILQQIKRQLLSRDDLSLISDYLIRNFHEVTIDEILGEIIQQKAKFLRKGRDLEDVFSISQKIITKINQNYDHLYDPIMAMNIIHDIVGYGIKADQLKKFFLTDSGSKRKRIVPKKIADPVSNLYRDLEILQHKVYELDQIEKQKQLDAHSELLSILGSVILQSYEKYKSRKGLLDYDDLIIYSNNLLHLQEAKEWVLYKLDGGIDHLLVDEAQDTSSSQWQIIEAMIEEFYASNPQHDERNRTIFVVGDEKQSIFSFQGANILSFDKMNKLLNKRMISCGKTFENINLEISYRSAQEVLTVVDHLFNKISLQMPDMFKASSLTKLTAFRNDHSGSVQLWPVTISSEDSGAFWPRSEDHVEEKSSKVALAKKISLYIKEQLSSEIILPATGKKITPGDFMILFRKRDEFTDEVIKSLKSEDINVAGLDRISLRDNFAVLDLLSVAKFVSNNYDDLNLASLLKSPLIGASEEELYNIATSRKKMSIWDYISSKTELDASLKDLHDKLNIFIDLYNSCNISNFFQYIVDILDYRKYLSPISGVENNDAIDEFLYICNNFISETDSSIANFIFWFESYDSSIKRDNSSSNKVKIMTLHASKGLQSPFVILCDTTSIPTNLDRFISDKNGNNLSAKNSSSVPDSYKEIKEEKKNQAYAEYLRLLYVGMTRAEDHLIICGYKGGKELPDNCWYQLVCASMMDLTDTVKIAEENLIYGKMESKSHQEDQLSSNNKDEKTLYLEQSVKVKVPLKPKKQFKKHAFISIASPLSKKDPMGYGLIFHKILEDSLSAKNLSLMSSHPLISTLDKKSQTRIRSSIDLILANDKFCDLSKKDLRTELSLGSNISSEIKIGRIDLVVMDKKEIIIIDYKSDRKPRLAKSEISQNYQKQLYGYKNIMSKLYPDKNIRMMLLWLENGTLREVL